MTGSLNKLRKKDHTSFPWDVEGYRNNVRVLSALFSVINTRPRFPVPHKAYTPQIYSWSSNPKIIEKVFSLYCFLAKTFTFRALETDP